MGGIYVDREDYTFNTNRIALYRYFLEPLGVSVDKWSMGVRGRSRTYTFADVFSTYGNVIEPALSASLLDPARSVPGLTNPNDCGQLINAINLTLGSLPAPDAVPFYTDVQRIFNKSCIECHGGLDYPPYATYGTLLNLSENDAPPAGESPLVRPHGIAASRSTSLTAPIYRFITRTGENCPPGATGMMPCGGPPLSQSDIDTIRRWINGGHPYSEGDPHLKTIDGTNYDFQSAGEFVLLRDDIFEVQTRQSGVETDGPLGPGHLSAGYEPYRRWWYATTD
jgi:mono/diheme cytochrome c family protein